MYSETPTFDLFLPRLAICLVYVCLHVSMTKGETCIEKNLLDNCFDFRRQKGRSTYVAPKPSSHEEKFEDG